MLPIILDVIDLFRRLLDMFLSRLLVVVALVIFGNQSLLAELPHTDGYGLAEKLEALSSDTSKKVYEKGLGINCRGKL